MRCQHVEHVLRLLSYLFSVFRAECCKDGMHRKTVAGISGNGDAGAFSIVLSGGYEDDDDEGDTL